MTTHTVIGTRPTGTATGDERWATIHRDDTTVVVTVYRGWGITDEVRLSGPTARGLANRLADELLRCTP